MEELDIDTWHAWNVAPIDRCVKQAGTRYDAPGDADGDEMTPRAVFETFAAMPMVDVY